MTAFVKECRQEWKRLGVPDLLADEMAADLEADLAEAEAEGVSTAEIVGESDPRRFAATWASERGLVPEQRPQKRRRRVWPWVVVFVFIVLFLSWLALQAVGTSHARNSPPAQVPPARRATVPNLVGKRACRAEKIALAAGLIVRGLPRSRCHSLVVAQTPAAGTRIRAQAPRSAVKLRLRARR
ncbi:MAG TPA: PASTA domain-containing protein [Gaiellaceae bacterium]